MSARKDALKDRLSRYREIKTVTARNSGRAISMPIWFVLDDENLYLLFRCRGRKHNGTRTCARTRQSASMPGAQQFPIAPAARGDQLSRCRAASRAQRELPSLLTDSFMAAHIVCGRPR
jgi:hypothetical protein